MPFQSCKKCGADLTTLIDAKEYCVGCTPEDVESQTTDTQQPQYKICPECNGDGRRRVGGLALLHGDCWMCSGSGKLRTV